MVHITPSHTGKTLSAWRRDKNLTQQLLSDELNVSRSYLKDIETGRAEPSFNFLKSFSDRFGVNSAMMFLSENNEDTLTTTNLKFSPTETLPRKGIAKYNMRGWGKPQTEKDPLPKPVWLDDLDAFYVTAAGQSMVSEGIDASNFCLVSPAKTIEIGDRVWIKDKEGKASIKRLVGMDDKWVDLLGWEPIADGKQTSFEDKHAISYMDAMYPVIAVYRGKPGNDNVEFKPDPKATPVSEPAIVVNANEYSHSIIKLHDIQAAAGSGSYVQDEKAISSLAFPNLWLSKIGINPNDASLIYAKGTSMAPTIQDGAMVLIDHRKRDIKKKHIYVFREGAELYVKRLEMITPETMIVSSDNPDFETRLLQGFDLDNVEVIGEIAWQGAKV